jgi:hypothetical protein
VKILQQPRCQATTKDGRPCKARPVKNGLCTAHQPDANMRELGQKGGIASGRARLGIISPELADDNLRAQARRRLEKLVNSSDEKVALQASRALFSYGLTPAPGDPDYYQRGLIARDTDRSASLKDVAALLFKLKIQAIEDLHPDVVETLERLGWTPPASHR